MKILLTGMAGFIGFHLAKKLSKFDHEILGIDSINAYYDVNLKYNRLRKMGFIKTQIQKDKKFQSTDHKNISFIQLDISDNKKVRNLFDDFSFDIVINLAAQAGVRYSLKNPMAYINSNIVGFLNILESCKSTNVKHLIYASSSSVYGLNEIMPFSTHHNVDHPVSLYAASKKSNELMAHTYSHLFGLPTTGLRFFTVYGPWGRPDMALYIFTKAILEGCPINVYNKGNMQRDFTYIDDIVEGIARIVEKEPPHNNTKWSGKSPDPGSSTAPYRVYNIGNNKPVKLLDFIHAIEIATGKKAIKNLQPMQPGDVVSTFADVSDLMQDFGYKPDTSIQEGVDKFVKWFRHYYKL